MKTVDWSGMLLISIAFISLLYGLLCWWPDSPVGLGRCASAVSAREHRRGCIRSSPSLLRSTAYTSCTTHTSKPLQPSHLCHRIRGVTTTFNLPGGIPKFLLHICKLHAVK